MDLGKKTKTAPAAADSPIDVPTIKELELTVELWQSRLAQGVLQAQLANYQIAESRSSLRMAEMVLVARKKEAAKPTEPAAEPIADAPATA